MLTTDAADVIIKVAADFMSKDGGQEGPGNHEGQGPEGPEGHMGMFEAF